MPVLRPTNHKRLKLRVTKLVTRGSDPGRRQSAVMHRAEHLACTSGSRLYNTHTLQCLGPILLPSNTQSVMAWVPKALADPGNVTRSTIRASPRSSHSLKCLRAFGPRGQSSKRQSLLQLTYLRGRWGRFFSVLNCARRG